MTLLDSLAFGSDAAAASARGRVRALVALALALADIACDVKLSGTTKR